jgi:hypothetical protein
VIAKRGRSDDRQRVFMAVREGIKEIRVGTVSIRAIMGGLEERTPDVRSWTKRSAGEGLTSEPLLFVES